MMKLSDDEITRELGSLAGWRREGEAIARDYELADFVAALGLIAQIGALAERADHHPTLTNTYSRVGITLSTHDVGGITENDFALARAIEVRVA